MIILGLKPYGHDTSAAIVVDGKIIAASAEERFNREKHSRAFPREAISFCLKRAGVKDINEITEVAIGFDYLRVAYHQDFVNFFKYFPRYTKEAITNGYYQMQKVLSTRKYLRSTLGYKGEIRFLDHHDCHAACCYYPSDFNESAILTVDGRGELASTRIYSTKGGLFKKLFQVDYPDSLGGFYSSITEYLGFQENSGEGKVMGLAPYGTMKQLSKMEKLFQIDKDGVYHLGMDYFEYDRNPKQGVSQRFIDEFGKPRQEDEALSQRHKDIARAAQIMLERAMMSLAQKAKQLTNMDKLCISGGVALNSVANGKIAKEKIFKDIYLYPASGDDGVSVGAALYSYYITNKGNHRKQENKSPYLGYSAKDDEILKALKKYKLQYKKAKNIEKESAKLLAHNKLIGWYQGRAEFGPRALGNRSILVNPTIRDNKDLVNSKVKFREAFRPFAPVVLEELSDQWFSMNKVTSPYMILAFNVLKEKIKEIPAVTHVDNTARVQTVTKSQNIKYWNIINEFYRITKVPVLLNTSFNRKGEPIVNTPEDAIKCFLRCGLDVLVLGDYLVTKKHG